MLILALSATLESPTFKKSIFRNYVVLRNRGAIKLRSRGLGCMLNLRSQSNCVYHLPYFRYYALKFQLRKIDLVTWSTGHVISYFRLLTHFSLRIWWSNSKSKLFRIHRNKVWIQPMVNERVKKWKLSKQAAYRYYFATYKEIKKTKTNARTLSLRDLKNIKLL